MARRIGAIFGMAVVVGLALVLLWQVHLHNAETPNGRELTTVSVSASEKITRQLS
jgi:cytoskeletal protein RodZ